MNVRSRFVAFHAAVSDMNMLATFSQLTAVCAKIVQKINLHSACLLKHSY